MSKVAKNIELPMVPLKLFKIENTESFKTDMHTQFTSKCAFGRMCKLDCNYGNERIKHEFPGT